MAKARTFPLLISFDIEFLFCFVQTRMSLTFFAYS